MPFFRLGNVAQNRRYTITNHYQKSKTYEKDYFYYICGGRFVPALLQ